jgi:hypothetical protein
LPRPVTIAALLAVLLTGLTACSKKPVEATDVVSAVDLARTTVMSSDPVLTNAVAPPDVMPGQYRSAKVGWDRSQVSARVFLARTPPNGVDPTPAEVEAQMTAVVTQLRAGGWRVHWAYCRPQPAARPASPSPEPSGAAVSPTPAPSPEPSPTPSPEPSPTPSAEPSPTPEAAPSPTPHASASPTPTNPALTGIPDDVVIYDEAWEEIVLVNKVLDGVSYWGMVSSAIAEKRGAYIDVVMRAPNARETPNLFPTAPPDLPAGSTCAEDGKPSTAVQAAGVPLIVKDWDPFPGASRAADPHRL